MTHPISQVDRALELRASGLTGSAIAECLGIPRRTVNDWIRGHLRRQRGIGAMECTTCGARHGLEELPQSYVYLLGLYLGDGSLASHPRGVYKLRLTLDAVYPKIIVEAAAAMGQVLPASKVNTRTRSSGDVEVYSYSKSWPCLFPQHGPGKKHFRQIVLTEWQGQLVRGAPHLLLRGLIHSDGCRFMNTGRRWRHPRYSFSNLSSDIRLIFTDACDLMGIHWTTFRPHRVRIPEVRCAEAGPIHRS
ncbi:MAG: helix-turn-helix domain-containing protein [Actinobacteria bacterium]|nr:helix-turn-helix domain-containing protein [Actinomycetota bacterium]